MDTSLKNINDENILDNIFNEAMDLIEKGNIEQGLENCVIYQDKIWQGTI